MVIVLWILFIGAIFLEGTITTLPLTLIFLLCFILMRREESVLLVAFLAGLLLDFLTLRPLGESSVFFLCVLFLSLLYERKYEINSFPFVIFSSFFSSLFYLWIFQARAILPQVGISVLLAIVLFYLYRWIGKSRLVKPYYLFRK